MKFKVNDYILVNDDNDCCIKGGVYQVIDIYYTSDYEIISVDDNDCDCICSICCEKLERIAELY